MFLTCLGSPPHVREVLYPAMLNNINIRITPACAGSTTSFVVHKSFVEDHPRMCGKYLIFQLLLLYLSGSPPHVREVPYLQRWQVICNRITPACAGSTQHIMGIKKRT